MAVQKICEPEIARLLPCMVLFLENLRRLSIFSNYIREIDHLDPEREYKRLIMGGILDLMKKIKEASI